MYLIKNQFHGVLGNKHKLLSILSFFLIVTCFACSMNKVTEVTIKNENDFPIAVTLAANNCRQTFSPVEPNAAFKGIFDWTQIEKKDGQWIILVTNEQTGGTDSFAHGYFTQGELNSFAELIAKGSELKIKISE